MMAECEQLGLTTDLPLERWLRSGASGEPATSGYITLAGNATAHEDALRCRLSKAGNELLLSTPWYRTSCAAGCSALVDGVAQELHRRSGLWSVVLIREAQLAPPAALDALAMRFFQQARCSHLTASARLNADCRRVLFVLSTSWGATVMSQLDVRDRTRDRLQASALVEAAPWMSSTQLMPRKRLRASFAVVLGEAPDDRFAELMLQQDAQRATRAARAAQGTHVPGALPDRSAGQAGARLADLSVFDRVSGQSEVVREVRERLHGIASGADGGEDAHTFFFYGFPGTGKTLIGELVALAQHGRTTPPHYQRFSMQNYRTDEDMWKIVSPPCGVKGEGAFAALFAARLGCSATASPAKRSACVDAPPVILFDEIEEARSDFMTSALVNAIDRKGFVEFTVKSDTDGCTTEQAPTAGSFIILTSNCFMEDLAEVLAAEKRPGRTEAEVYAATRREMDRRIFEEGIPCDANAPAADRRPNPFASRKMRDRMQGNVYPFLPLSDEQMVQAFETELDGRARSYLNTRGVHVYWTSSFARLIATDQRDPRMAALGLQRAATGLQRAAGATAGKAGEPTSPHSTATGSAPSLRKRIEQLVRLNEMSVEKLYARGSAHCTASGAVLAKLVLHVSNSHADATPYCNATSAEAATAMAKPLPTANGGVCAVAGAPVGCATATPAAATSGGGSARRGAPAPAQAHAARDVDVETATAVEADKSMDDAIQRALTRQARTHAADLEAAKQREAHLSKQVARLSDTLAEVERQLRRWQLVSAALALVAFVACLGTGHLLLAYAALAFKAVAFSTALTAIVSGTALMIVAVACRAGSQLACSAQAAMLEVAQWAWSVVQLSWQLLGWAWKTLGSRWLFAAATATGICLYAGTRRAWRKRLAVEASRARLAALEDQVKRSADALDTERRDHAEALATERRQLTTARAALERAEVELIALRKELKSHMDSVAIEGQTADAQERACSACDMLTGCGEIIGGVSGTIGAMSSTVGDELAGTVAHVEIE